MIDGKYTKFNKGARMSATVSLRPLFLAGGLGLLSTTVSPPPENIRKINETTPLRVQFTEHPSL